MDTSNKSSRTTIILVGIGILVVLILFAYFRNNPNAATPTNTPVPTLPPPPTDTPRPNEPPADTPDPIQNIIWMWTTLVDQSTGQTTTVSNPASYTISFYPDGTLDGKADCNTFAGTYSQRNGFEINIGQVTRAACPEGSLEQQFLDLLTKVAAGGPDGSGGLALETAGGSQRMIFINGGGTVKP